MLLGQPLGVLRCPQASAAAAIGCCRPGRYASPLPRLPAAQPSESRGSSSSGDILPPFLPRPPSWELGNLRTWVGLGLAQLVLTLAQGLGFLNKAMGLAGLQRDN